MHSTIERRQAIRAALRIHAHLVGTPPAVAELPQAAWEELHGTTAQLQRAFARGWRVAGQRLLEDLDYGLQRMIRELGSFRQDLPHSLRSKVRSSPSEILSDLDALETEFDDVTLDLQQQLISVRTDPIELEEVHLGSFRIELHWNYIGDERAYEVIAVDPHPPEGDDSVTHPHLRDRILCEGEGAAPIKAALAQGRLLDFFTLVRQILETYNPSSAHVQLNRWNGVSCRDCGWRMPSDDYGTCERCDGAVCSDCTSSCGGCDRAICGGCSSLCAACDGSFCRSCLSQQPGSGQLVCEACLNSEEDACDESVESPAADDSSAVGEENETRPATAGAAADALCVREATFPA